MKVPAVARALGYIHEDLIQEVLEYEKKKKQIVWKKWAGVAACIVILLGVANFLFKRTPVRMVAENELYTVMDYGGTYTLRFKESLPAGSPADNNTSIGVTPVTFDSLAKMKEAIETGKFTEKQLETIRKFFSRRGDEIISLDLSKLYDAVLPEDMAVSSVSWHGKSYVLGVGNDAVSGSLRFLSSEEYREEMKEREENIRKQNVTSTENLEDRNALQYEYTAPSGIEVRLCTYTYESGGKILHIWEYYNLKDSALGVGSSTVPSDFRILGEDNGVYFKISLSGMLQRPDYEWLKSFGIELFKG